MALPVPSATPPAASSSAAGDQTPASAAHLTARADRLLAGGDIDGYRSLFTEAARLEDPGRRYHAQVVLVESGIEAAARMPSEPAGVVLLAVAGAAVELLEAHPSEPVLLNCAAVAMDRLGTRDAALGLFGAAQRLDSSLPGLEQRIAAAQRCSEGPRPVSAALSNLAQRALLAAEAARPAAGLTLSLCMIVRDEEKMLPLCLEAIAPVVDELVVVDTGSRDATIEIARSFGARVIEHEWTDSFAEARNISFDAATGDWLMYLDADEVLVSDDAEQLRALTGQTWREAFYLVETSHLGETGDGFAAVGNLLRMVRNRPQYRFTGRVHEQIAHALPVYAPGRIHHTAVRIQHYGYLESVRSSRAKSRRNIALLRKQAEESSPDAFLHFNLGAEHAADGNTAAALTEFEQAWSMIVAQGGASGAPRYAPTLVARLVEAMRRAGRLEDAAGVAAEGLRRYPGFTDLVFAQARIALETGALDDAAELFRRCIQLGDAPTLYRPTVGAGTYLPRIALAQLALTSGDDEMARALLAWCLEHHPSFPGAVAPYVSLLLGSGMPADATVAEVERRLKSVTPSMRLVIGSALQDAGQLSAAETQYRSVIADQPDNGRARLALAQALLHLGDNDGAATQAAQVSPDDPFASAAFPIELCALVSSGDPDGASGTFARARERLSEIEREVFGTWLTIASGRPAPRTLPAAAAVPIKPILEMLLQARNFRQFELLVPALENSDLPTRDRRELLGDIYLRHGFLASAAKEWMAVCAQRPDAAALLGLARVALANDQPQDATVFASGALELEPENAAAAEILRRVQGTANRT